MKLLKVFLIISLAFAMNLELFSQEASSKVPVERFGVGVLMNGQATGVTGAFAFSENLHAGLGLGLAFDLGTDAPEDDGGTAFYLSPFLTYYLQNIGNLFPFVQAQLSVSSLPIMSQTINMDRTDLQINVGGTWFPYSSIAVSGGFNFVNFNTDASRLVFGLGGTFMSIQWFFN